MRNIFASRNHESFYRYPKLWGENLYEGRNIMHVIFEYPSGGYTTHSPAPPGLQTPDGAIRREFSSKSEMDAAVFNYASPLSQKWELALIAIHTSLALGSPTCPFCQIRMWADTDLTLDARVRDFTQAFLQPLAVKSRAVQSGLYRVWAALTPQQQTDLNKDAIDVWEASYSLGLEKPWNNT